MGFEERMKYYKRRLPNHPKAEEAFEKMIDGDFGKRKSPSVAMAVIEYIVHDLSQEEAANANGVTSVSLRGGPGKILWKAVASFMGYDVENVYGSIQYMGHKTKEELSEDIKSVLYDLREIDDSGKIKKRDMEALCRYFGKKGWSETTCKSKLAELIREEVGLKTNKYDEPRFRKHELATIFEELAKRESEEQDG